MKQSHGAKKSKRGHFGLFENPVCCKILKNSKRGLFGDKKLEKKRSVPKNSKGDPIVSSGFVSYVRNGANEKGTLCTVSDAFPLSGPLRIHSVI